MQSFTKEQRKWMTAVVLGCFLAGGAFIYGQRPTPASPAAPVAEQPTAAAQQSVPLVRTHTVAEGETLSTIAEKYQLQTDTVMAANPTVDETALQPGATLKIPPRDGVYYTTVDGDTLSQLASAFGIEASAIIAANQKNSEELQIGEDLFLPGAKAPLKETIVARAETPVSRSSVQRFSWPARGELSSPFGRRWGRMHAGMDIANDVGTSVRAALSGRVSYVGWYSGYGRTVIVEHENGYTTLYGHLNEFNVEAGQYVRNGQVIAYMGNTGYSTGPHLHFEVHRQGEAIDPMQVLP